MRFKGRFINPKTPNRSKATITIEMRTGLLMDKSDKNTSIPPVLF
jgi:hypothetical protein